MIAADYDAWCALVNSIKTLRGSGGGQTPTTALGIVESGQVLYIYKQQGAVTLLSEAWFNNWMRGQKVRPVVLRWTQDVKSQLTSRTDNTGFHAEMVIYAYLRTARVQGSDMYIAADAIYCKHCYNYLTDKQVNVLAPPAGVVLTPGHTAWWNPDTDVVHASSCKEWNQQYPQDVPCTTY
jgi:hypothetical protein